MKIEFSPEVALKLMTFANITRGAEFSGFGFVDVEGETIKVYDVVILDIGSEVFTDIKVEKMLELMVRPDAKKMKLWFHRHPVGNGVPGPHNWSGTDNATIKEGPLGGLPDLVKWSCSAVLTPHGWVGRIDNHLKDTTAHIEVFPQSKDAYEIFESVDRSDEESRDLYLELAKSRFSEDVLDDLGMTYEDLADYLEMADCDGDILVEKYFDKNVPDEIIYKELEVAVGPY